MEDTLAFLRKREPLLDGVVFSGGECLLSSGVEQLVREVKKIGYAVKIDTNGAKPERLKTLIDEGVVDYVAMDFKSPLEDYENLTGWNRTELWEKSFEILQCSGVEYELRTTVHADLIDETTVGLMMDYLEKNEYRGSYWLQHFQASGRTLGDIAEPSRRFDLSRLDLQRPFSVKFRNFSDHEVKQALRG